LRLTLLSAIGPVTVLAGIVWSIAQPYRLTLLSDTRSGVWDHLAQPPLLVAGVGLLFWFAVARPLARTLRGGR
jgi:hypothetical protein